MINHHFTRTAPLKSVFDSHADPLHSHFLLLALKTFLADGIRCYLVQSGGHIKPNLPTMSDLDTIIEQSWANRMVFAPRFEWECKEQPLE